MENCNQPEPPVKDQHHNELTFQLMVEASPNALLLVNMHGVIMLINSRTEKLFGYSRKELIGEKIEILIPNRFKDLHPGYRDKFLEKPQSRPMGVGRYLFAQKKNGVEIPVEIGLNPVETKEGNLTLASITDITERKKIEESLKINAKRIQEKNKELEQFTYIASHDLQEPLNTITSFIELLQNNLEGKLTETDKKSFQFISQSSYRMKELIKGLLDYSRIGKKSKLKTIDCNELVKSVCDDLNNLIQKSNVKISIGKLPTIKAYDTEIRLLFQNIIGNAIKFHNPEVDPEIKILGTTEDPLWKFTIEDNGIGIDPKYKDKIFLIYQRLHNSKEYKGSGIGLAHCRKIVELHNGDLWVESKLGFGSTFYFTINSNIE